MKIPQIPNKFDWMNVRLVLNQMRNALIEIQKTTMAPRPVINLTATGKPLGILIQFTRTDGDSYVIYRNTTAQINGAVKVELGNNGIWTDELGAGALVRYYWVKARKGSIESTLTGPVSATSLVAGAAFTPPAAPPAVDEPVYSDETGYPTE